MERRQMRRPMMRRDSRDFYDNRQHQDRYREPRYDYDRPRSEYRDEYRDYESRYDNYDDGYDDECTEQEYVQYLEDWIQRLKSKVKVDTNYDLVIKLARDMAIKFREFTELEFYATYLMLASDFPYVSGDPRIFVQMAKSFLEDDDISVSPSEKLCIYLCKIVKGM